MDNKCPKCSKEIDLGEMEIHEKKIVVCSNCDTKWGVVMHGDGPLFEEVKESPIIGTAKRRVEESSTIPKKRRF